MKKLGYAGVLVAALAMPLGLVTSLAPAHAATPPVWAAAPAAAADAGDAVVTEYRRGMPCQDITIIGARGSGEVMGGPHRMGATTGTAVARTIAGLRGYRVGVASLVYDAQAVDLLAVDPKKYFAGLNEGVATAGKLVAERTESCRNEKFILVGYSQGAMVMHRLILGVSAEPKKVGRWLIGALLIADGDRRIKDQVISTPIARSLGISGHALGKNISGATSNRAIPTLPAPIWSICAAGDVVCHPLGASSLPRGVKIHEKSYLDNRFIRAAADMLASRGRARVTSTACPPSRTLIGKLTSHPEVVVRQAGCVAGGQWYVASVALAYQGNPRDIRWADIYLRRHSSGVWRNALGVNAAFHGGACMALRNYPESVWQEFKKLPFHDICTEVRGNHW